MISRRLGIWAILGSHLFHPLLKYCSLFYHSFQPISQYTICPHHLRKLTDKEENKVT